MGLRERGINNINRALTLDPLNLQGLNYVASLASGAGELPTAKMALERGLALSPGDS